MRIATACHVIYAKPWDLLLAINKFLKIRPDNKDSISNLHLRAPPENSFTVHIKTET